MLHSISENFKEPQDPGYLSSRERTSSLFKLLFKFYKTVEKRTNPSPVTAFSGLQDTLAEWQALRTHTPSPSFPRLPDTQCRPAQEVREVGVHAGTGVRPAQSSMLWAHFCLPISCVCPAVTQKTIPSGMSLGPESVTWSSRLSHPSASVLTAASSVDTVLQRILSTDPASPGAVQCCAGISRGHFV